MIVLCYAGFLRIDELISTQLKHVLIKDRHMEIFLAESKTDKSREGSTVFIARTDTAYCPVSLVEKYLLHRVTSALYLLTCMYRGPPGGVLDPDFP